MCFFLTVSKSIRLLLLFRSCGFWLCLNMLWTSVIVGFEFWEVLGMDISPATYQEGLRRYE